MSAFIAGFVSCLSGLQIHHKEVGVSDALNHVLQHYHSLQTDSSTLCLLSKLRLINQYKRIILFIIFKLCRNTSLCFVKPI